MAPPVVFHAAGGALFLQRRVNCAKLIRRRRGSNPRRAIAQRTRLGRYHSAMTAELNSQLIYVLPSGLGIAPQDSTRTAIMWSLHAHRKRFECDFTIQKHFMNFVLFMDFCRFSCCCLSLNRSTGETYVSKKYIQRGRIHPASSAVKFHLVLR